jgi:hypothetical protein
VPDVRSNSSTEDEDFWELIGQKAAAGNNSNSAPDG